MERRGEERRGEKKRRLEGARVKGDDRGSKVFKFVFYILSVCSSHILTGASHCSILQMARKANADLQAVADAIMQAKSIVSLKPPPPPPPLFL